MLPLFSLSFSPTEEASKPKQPPTFAKDFYVGLQTNLGINQGGYRLPSGDVWCTHPFAPSASTSPDPLSAPLRGGEVLSRLSTTRPPNPSAAARSCSVSTSPQCKVQYINQGSDHREQGSMNRTREDSPQGVIVTWYGSVRKQMALAQAAGGSRPSPPPPAPGPRRLIHAHRTGLVARRLASAPIRPRGQPQAVLVKVWQ